MKRHFNTAGPCNPDLYYMVPVMSRLPGVRQLIEQQAYFVLHAPRQVGKTTSLLALARELTSEGRYSAVLVSMETGAPFFRRHHHGGAGHPRGVAWRRRGPAAARRATAAMARGRAGARVGTALKVWSQSCPRPLVVFLDEIDSLQDDLLISVLRQIRGRYLVAGADRHAGRARLQGSSRQRPPAADRLQTTSPFNIKIESLTLRDFTADEVDELYHQHTGDTGQRFEPGAVARAFELTQGQPWLVNALARQLIEVVVPDATRPITGHDVDLAREILIRRNDTHLDSLTERLREPRGRRSSNPFSRAKRSATCAWTTCVSCSTSGSSGPQPLAAWRSPIRYGSGCHVPLLQARKFRRLFTSEH